MSVFSRIANVFRSGRLYAELDEEMRLHIEQRIEHLTAAGMDPNEAAAFVRRRFGNRLRLRESSHDVKALRWLESLMQDVHFGARMLWKDRAAMAAAVISLSLSLGACSTAFSLIDALILRPLPVAHPDELFYVSYPDLQSSAPPGVPRERNAFNYSQYQSFSQAAGVALNLFGVNLSAGLTPAVFDGTEEQVRVEGMSGNGFDVLGVPPAAGRLFTASDDTGPTESPVAILSYAFWSRRFGSDPSAFGSIVTIGEHHFRIIGVARQGFSGLTPGYLTDLWIPLTSGVDARTLASRDATWINVWGRRRPGMGGEQALKVAWTDLRRDQPRTGAVPLLINPAGTGADSLFRMQFAHPLWIFGLFSGLLLLIATSNVANLLIARAVARRREMALRIALGAGRRRLVRQLLIESALLAALACSLGIVFGAIAAPFLTARLGISNFPAWLDLRPDWRLLGFMTLLGTVATLFFGVVPAFRASGVNPDEALKSSAHQASSTNALRPLLPVQVAFSFMVLFFSGLLLLSFARLTRIDLGFAPDHVILFDVSGKGVNPDVPGRLLDRIRGVAGVDSASLSQQAPMGGAFAFVMTPFIRFPGRDVESVRPAASTVSPGFFHTMRIRLLEGRELEPGDPDSAVVVNEAFVQQYLAGGRVLGQRFEQIGDGPPVSLQIVGVVANSLFNNLREEVRPMLYTPLGKLGTAAIEVRTVPDPRALTTILRREIESIDPALHVRDSILQSTRISNTLVTERLLAWLAAFFGIAALILAGVGLNGVIGYFVARRTKEIGVRMALGAERPAVVRLIVRNVATLIALGIAAGIAGSLALARYAESLLFEVSPTDFLSLGAPLIVLLGGCVLAALSPAVRATRLDPVTTLRYE